MRQIILDTETTGLDPKNGDRIIEIGCLEMINRKLTGKRYHQYINPEREVHEEALAVHGITNEFLLDKPLFSEVIEELMNFISGAELIIHNAPFDIGFLDHELKLARSSWKTIKKHCRIIDTLPIARQLHIGQRNSLDALCKRYGVDNSQRDLHGALVDVHLLAQVYLAMTGGQSSFFDTMSQENVKSELTEEIINKTILSRQLPIIKANSEELMQHEEKLKEMIAKGKCLWHSP